MYGVFGGADPTHLVSVLLLVAACRFVCGSRAHFDPFGAVVDDGEGGGSEGVGESEGAAVRNILGRGDGESDRFAVSLDRERRLHALGDILAIAVEDASRRLGVHGDDAARPDAVCQGQDVGLQCADDSIDLRLRRFRLCFVHEMQSGGHDDGGKDADDGDDDNELNQRKTAPSGLPQYVHLHIPVSMPDTTRACGLCLALI